MNFPTVEFAWFGNGHIIAIIAIIHVIINHGVAIGGTALMVSLEYRAYQTNNNDLMRFTRNMSKWILIITTTLGAMTGVGIWFSTTIIQPDAIGSLLRIFFWAWFAEWLVFITEVALILVYYYTWDRWKGRERMKHIRIGIALSFFSWFTMTIITGVLAAKLTPGRWNETLSFWNAFFNESYIPSLLFRTVVSIVLAISIFAVFTKLFIKKKELQRSIFEVFGAWNAVALPAILLFGMFYLLNIPQEAYNLVLWSTGMTKNMFVTLNSVALLVMLVFAFWMAKAPQRTSVIVSMTAFVVAFCFIGEFEMVRESVRKPFMIYNYMYVNGVRVNEVETFKSEGYLKYSTFSDVKEVTKDNRYEAGEAIYQGQCMACHTVDGWRSKRAYTARVNGWSEQQLSDYIATLHQTRTFMPPFAGTDEEREALAHYIIERVKEETKNEVASQ